MFAKLCSMASLSLVFACGQQQTASSSQGLADDVNGRNGAVIFGAPHNLSGVPTDVREFGNLLNNQAYGFHVQTVQSNQDATAQQIFDMTAQVVANSDSLIWYFSGHGNTGIILAQDRTFTFDEVAEVIKRARNNVPLKRLVVFVDSCYSGSFVDGNNPIIDENGKVVEKKLSKQENLDWAEQTFFSTLSQKDSSLYEQAFVLASSTKNESSVDLGSSQGGAFTWALRQVVKEAAETNPSITIGDFAKKTSEETDDIGGHTPVYKAFPSQAILTDWLFRYE